jgi:hypothetical protein
MLASIFHIKIFTPKCLGFLFLAFGMSSQVNAFNFNVNPNNIGLNGGAFIADTLTVKEVSNVIFTDLEGGFHEASYGYVNGAEFKGSNVTTTGLGSDYTLYFQFSGVGNNLTGQFSSGSISLYAVNGLSIFDFDPATHAAQVNNNGNTPIFLGMSNFNSGIVTQTAEGLSARVDSSIFFPSASGASFFGITSPSINLAGAFSYTLNEIVLTPTGFQLAGGRSSLNIAAVPVPTEWAMMMLGTLLIGRMAHGKQTLNLMPKRNFLA